MKKLILAVLGLLVIGVAGAALYISSIDWNEHKDQIANRFYEMTGKKIVFGGPVSLQFLPYPSLSATNVKILNPQDLQAKPLVEVRRLTAELAGRPLMSGDLQVRRMVLDQPKINIELLDGGRLNWQANAEDAAPKAEISLNSVSLNDATVTFEDAQRNINTELNNLSGEIVATSLYGPYRIEGNYIKDNNPQGFAISVGKLSDSFATSLNMVFTHPVSKSYVRFDGSFFLQNKVLNGNVIFEAAKLKNFAEANFPELKFDENYDYPLALTFDIAFNERQLNLSNMVIKYGESQGAGNVQIPLNDGVFGAGDDGVKPRVDMAFNFTDFNLDPVAYTFKNLLAKYNNPEAIYQPNLPFDVLADVKSVRTQYNGQAVKNFEASFDLIENIITVNNVSAILPGDTSIKLKGSLSSFEERPFYNFDGSFSSVDFLKALNWAGISPQVSVASTYKKANGSLKISGTLDKVQISPFAITIDKSSLSGEAGIKLGDRKDMMLVLNADSVNFDNYISALPVEEKEKTFASRMQYRFAQLGVLNNFDMQLIVKMNLAIYENMPFEKVSMDAVLLNGKLDISQFSIASVASAAVDAKGQLSGFGNRLPNMQELYYEIKTENLAAFISKLELKAPDLDYKKLNKLTAKGTISGDVDRFAINSDTSLENMNVAFKGQVNNIEKANQYSGDLEIKHPDFVKMLEDLNSPYLPRGQSLGLFNMRSRINGNPQQFTLSVEEANIGYNKLSGNVSYENTDGRPHLMTELSANKFEIERFLSKETSSAPRASLAVEKAEIVDFLASPNWSRNKIDYSFYQKFDLSGTFIVQDLSYYANSFREANLTLSLVSGVLEISKATAKLKNADVELKAGLNMREAPTLTLSGKVENYDVATSNWSGKVYGINKGLMQSKFNLAGGAESVENFAQTLKGNTDLSFSDFGVKGWNLAANWDDIKQRETSEGLALVIKNNLSSGVSSFNTFDTNVAFDKGVFALSNAVMKGNGAEVKVYGEGSLSPWEMNLTFDVKYDESKYLPGYSFTLKGPTNAPLLDVNVSSLFNLYKSKQDKVDNDVKIAREAEENRLKLLVEEQKSIADKIVVEIRKEIDDNLSAKSKTAYDSDTNYKYDAIRQRAGKVVAELVEKVNFDEAAVVDDKLIVSLKEFNKKGAAELEKMKQELKNVYVADLKENIKDIYAKIVEEVNRSKQVVFQYNTTQESSISRLANVVTDYKLENDVNIKAWDAFMKQKADGFEPQSLKALDAQKAVLASMDEAKVSSYNMELKDLLTGLQADIVSMQETFTEMRKYADEKVQAEEDAYSQKIREQEVERKLEENKGSISIKKSGKTVEIVRDINDIEKAEELVEEREVKVLDFSRPKQKTPSGQDKVSGMVVKKGAGNR